MTRVYLSVSEKIDSRKHRSRYILHNGLQGYHTDTNNKEHIDELLTFFECELELDRVSEGSEETGKITFYNVSKDIISHCGGGFWNIYQILEQASGRRLKSFIGLSNGSLTTCYAAFDDDNNTVEILRPNPNAKDVYCTLPTDAHIEYARNHWVI